MDNLKIFIILFALFSIHISCEKNNLQKHSSSQHYYDFEGNRVAAEWEVAKGVIFMCPPVIPKNLIIEFAKDTHIYPVVGDDAEKAVASEWFIKWGIDTNRVHFIDLPKVDYDITVPRDWGPPAIFSNSNPLKLADVVFKNSAPFSDIACNDSLELHMYSATGEIYHSTIADTVIKPMARQLGIDIIEVPITSTGGNVLVDGVGTAISTCILLTENRFNGVTDQDFYQISDSLLGLSNYHIISNFEKDGIQHVDCFLKIIDEETLLVAQTPEDHELYEVYEGIVKDDLSQLRNTYDKPYKIERIQIGRIIKEYLSPYTNSLILNKTVYVPLYGIETDSLAIETWKKVLPGHSIKGFDFVIQDQEYLSDWFFEDYKEEGDVPGWGPDDALHCRTRAIWESEKILISVNKVDPEISSMNSAVLYASVKNYGQDGIEKDGVQVKWRRKGSSNWQSMLMTPLNNQHNWFAEFPVFSAGTSIEYYVLATTSNGNEQSRPITAPAGYYQFTYKGEI